MHSINKGSFAGGATTTKFGTQFEKMTNVYLNKEFNQYQHFDNKDNFKKYMKQTHNKDIFRNPDEVFIIQPIQPNKEEGEKPTLKILEKKHQNVPGSVETKLWAGPSLKREWELMLGDIYDIHYGFCISNWLKTQFTSGKMKYNILKKILEENNIVVLFGEDKDYFIQLKSWLNE
jgi:hypothetical protein